MRSIKAWAVAAMLLAPACMLSAQGVGVSPGVGGGGTGGAAVTLPVVTPETSGAKGDGKFVFDGSITAPSVVQASSNGSSTTPTAPSVTTTAANSLVVWAFLGNDAWSAAPTAGNGRIQQTFASGFYALTMRDEIAASAGATPTVSGTLASSKNWIAGSIGLQPVNGQSIAFIAQNNLTANTGTSLTVNTPTGAVAGDTLIACVDWYSSGSSITWPSGWITLFSAADGLLDKEDCGYTHLASAPPASYTWTTVGNFGGAVGILAYSNVNTVSTLTSSSASFTAADVGKPICTAGTGSAGAQQCGTITAVNSSSSVGVGYVAVTTGSSLWFDYGTNDDSAFNTMLTTAPCSTVGCRVQLQPHAYVLTQPLTLPPNRTIQFLGAGEGLANTENSYLNGNTAPNVNTGTRLLFTTNSMPSAAITIGGTVHTTSTTAFDLLSDLAIIGGSGKGRDGGGKDGVDILDWQGAELNRVGVVNFAGSGVYIDGLASGNYQDYIEDIILNGVYALWNGANGIKVGSTLGVFNLESVAFDNGIAENNGGPGVELAGANVQAFHAANNVIQWNNTTAADVEFKADHTPSGCVLEANYFESDSNAGSKSNGWITPSANCTVIANHVQLGGVVQSNFTGINLTSPVTTFGVGGSLSAGATNTSTGGYDVLEKATAALTAGQLVCLDTANADSVIVCPTTTTAQMVGFADGAISAAAIGPVMFAGKVSATSSTTCAIGNYVTASSTTAGDVACTATLPTQGLMLGFAETALGTAPGAVTVFIDRR